MLRLRWFGFVVAFLLGGCLGPPVAAGIAEPPCGYRVVATTAYAFAVPGTWSVHRDTLEAEAVSPYGAAHLAFAERRSTIGDERARVVAASRQRGDYLREHQLDDGRWILEELHASEEGPVAHVWRTVDVGHGYVFELACVALELEAARMQSVCEKVLDSLAVMR